MATWGSETAETTPLSGLLPGGHDGGEEKVKAIPASSSVDVCLTLGSGRGEPVGSVGRALLGRKWQHGLIAVLEDTQVCCICTLWVNAGKYTASEKITFHILC